MVRKLSSQRQAVLELVQREGRISPKHVGDVLGMNSGAARKLLFSMLSDGELASPERGKYTLPEGQIVTFEGDVTESAGVAEDVTETEESRIDMPILGDSPSGIWAFSVQDGGMVPRELVLRRKGYSS